MDLSLKNNIGHRGKAVRALVKYLNNIYKIWSIIFFVVLIDLIFEFMVGFNILGFKSNIPGRLASFTGNELVIGNFFSAFCLIFLSYISIKYPKKNNIIIFSYYTF